MRVSTDSVFPYQLDLQGKPNAGILACEEQGKVLKERLGLNTTVIEGIYKQIVYLKKKKKYSFSFSNNIHFIQKKPPTLLSSKNTTFIIFNRKQTFGQCCSSTH